MMSAIAIAMLATIQEIGQQRKRPMILLNGSKLNITVTQKILTPHMPTMLIIIGSVEYPMPRIVPESESITPQRK